MKFMWVKLLVRKPEGKRTFGGLTIDGHIMLKQNIEVQNVSAWTGFCWLNLDRVAGIYDFSVLSSRFPSIFLDQLSKLELLKKILYLE
jgi:hypothetical protein